MAARWAIPNRTRRPTGLKGIADCAGGPEREPEDPGAAPQEIERYLGNAYLQAAKGVSGRAAPAWTGPGRDADGVDAVAGEARDLSARRSVTLQAKLSVGAAGDAFEREADRIADALMHRAEARSLAVALNPEAPSQAEVAPVRISRPTTRGIDRGTYLAPEIAARVDRLRAGGVPLPERERALFEPLLGVDLDSVRIHTGVAAMQSARALNARAYTIGSDIVFGSGQYRPGTDSGRRLLAHELVHTVQQRDASPGPAEPSSVQCKGGGGSIVIEEVRQVRGQMGFLTITHDIQWHLSYGPGSGTMEGLVLFIDVPRVAKHGKPLSAMKVAVGSVFILLKQAGIRFKDGTGRAFAAYVASDLQRYGFTGDEGWIRHSYDVHTLLDYVELQSLQELRARFPKDPTLDDFLEGRLEPLPVVAKVDYVDPDKLQALAKERHLEQWAESKEATIRKLIEQARKQKPRPQDLPDKISARKGTKDWYLRVWVNYDRRGKKQATHIVRLRENESDEALFQRVRAATAEALFRDEDREKREREKEFPSWAKAKKRAVEEALAEQRRREKGGENFPDGIVLVAERQTAGPAPSEDAPAAADTFEVTRTSSEGAAPARVSKATVPLTTGDTQSPSYVYLQVWVERGTGKGYQRNTGTVPLPLTPETNVEELVRYIRTLATILRQYERAPSGQLASPAKSPEVTLPSEQALRAFPALLAPTDLPDGGITVSGARNEFHMQLDYEDVYGDGELKDLFIASKLFSQYIRFYWKVYKVPAAFKKPETAGSSPDWNDRLFYLYHKLNATDKQYPDARWENARYFDASVDTGWSDDDTDAKMRVKFPEMDETKDPPEDFIVYCETRHGLIGDEELKRVSSIAYYPVHVKPIRTVAKAAVSDRTHRIEMIERELEFVRAKLDPAKLKEEQLDETYQQVLLAIVQIKSDELEHLKALETKKPAEGIHAEIAFINGRLRMLSEIEKARKEGKEKKIAPSKLLKDQGRPDLLAMHLFLLWENWDIEIYTKQLVVQRERLTGSAKVAHTFKDDIKVDSPHQYNAETAMISTLTGLVYPLRLIIAEAPDNRKPFPGGIAYAVIDATSPETQDKYYGYSPTADSGGHLKAIQDALDDFGKDATYGEGLIVVRIPPPSHDQQGSNEAGSERTSKPVADAHPGPKITYHKSSPGPLQKVLWALSIIAFAAGAFALSLTGAGAPVAVALLSFIAAFAGAVGAAHNIVTRSSRHKLEWDPELALDIVSIVSVVPAGIGVKFARQASALRTNVEKFPAWLQSVERPQRLLRIYSASELGGTLYLVHEKLVDDIQKIELLTQRMNLSPVEKRKLREQAFGNAILSGVMIVGGAVAAHVGATVEPGPSSFVDRERLRQQADLLELEGLPRGYQTLQDRNVLDAQGDLTPTGRDFIDRVIPGASKRLTPAGSEPPTQLPPAIARPAVVSARPADVAAAAAQPRPRGSGREAAEVRAKTVSRSAGPGDVESAAQKGAPKRQRQKQAARAAEESRAAKPPAAAGPEAETGKGAPKKRPAKREPSPEERRPVSGKEPTGPAAGRTPSPLPAPEGVALRSNQIWHHDGRDVVIVDTPNGPQAFYRRTGWGSLGEKPRGGAQKGDWVPFEGFHLGGQMAKPQDLGEEGLHRWGTEEQRQIALWLESLKLSKGQDVGDEWSVIQRSLEHAGVLVRTPQYGGRAVAPPAPPPEPPRAQGPLPPSAPGSPPRPPAAPSGGGGGGAGRPTGVRPLHPVEAEFLEGTDPISSTRHEYDLSIIFDQNSYRARWRAATGLQGGEPPPHSYLDHNRQQIVVYRPRGSAPDVPPTGPTRPPGSVPPGPGRPDVTGRAPVAPEPGQARRELPTRPPSPAAPSPDVAPRARYLEDPPGRIERSSDRDHYFAREHFGDVIRHDGGVEIPTARYFVEAEFKDGIIEMDFVLRRDDVPGFKGSRRRSGQLRGQEEFQQVLDHFRGIHGEGAIKGIKGDWGGGDNLDRFNEVIGSISELDVSTDPGGWNNALKSAALETYTGDWARTAGFTEVEIVGFSASERNNKITFDQVEVIFHKSGAGGSGIEGGPGQAPPTNEGLPRSGSPKTPSSVRAPEFARPAASRTGGGPSPPPAAQTRRGPPSGPPPPAGSGGGGGRRRAGVRALTATEAAGVRPAVGLTRTRRGDWAISWVMSRDLYEAAWRDATGGQGDPAPPHGFLDRDRNQIVVFKPSTNLNVIARPQRPPPAPTLPFARRERSQPPARPDLTSRSPTRPYPAQAARDLPARPPSPPPANVPIIRRQPPPRRATNVHVIRRRPPPGPPRAEPTTPRPAVPGQSPDLTEPPRRPRSVSDEVNRDREGDATRIELEQSGGRREDGSPTPPARLPHDTDHPEVRGGLLDWLTRRRKLPKPQLGEQLSSGGDAGKLAYSGPGKLGVFEAVLPDGQTVAVKIYPDTRGRGDANQRERFARDMAALEAASRTSSGPRFHGEVNVGSRRRGFAMERIEGDFPEAQPRTDRELTDSERIAERLAQARITDRTLEDVKQFGNELLGQGYYYDGEIQGLIDFRGRYRPIDFEKVRPLSRDPRIRAEQTRNHQERISSEIADLQSLRRPPEDRLPSDLPVPADLQGLGQQRFGTDVMAWGSGVQGANDRLRAIRGNPQRERERLEANGLTLDMAKAWHVAYQHLDGQRHTAIFEARTELLAEIVKLMTR